MTPKASKLRKRAADVPGSTHDDVIHLVGHSRETDCEHRRRHPVGRGWAKSCPRCDYMANQTIWERSARFCGPTARLVARCETSWVCPKPAFLGGAWGLGCCLCAAARESKHVQRERVKVRKAYKEKGVAHQRMSRMNTKWARYDHRHAPKMLPECKTSSMPTAAASSINALARFSFPPRANSLGRRPWSPTPRQLVAPRRRLQLVAPRRRRQIAAPRRRRQLVAPPLQHGVQISLRRLTCSRVEFRKCKNGLRHGRNVHPALVI